MRKRHLDGVATLEASISHRPWSRDLFASELKQKNSRCVAAVSARSVVAGFACLMWSGADAHVTNIAVDVHFRRDKVATRLMLALFEASESFGADDLTLEVRATNRAAQRLYHQFGFVPEGIRPKYYRELNEDAVIMWTHNVRTPEFRERIQRVAARVGHG